MAPKGACLALQGSSAAPRDLTTMQMPYSGVILAGGLNTRFGGRNKAFIQIGGKTIFQRLYDLYRQLFEEIIVVTNDPLAYLDCSALIVSDLFSIRSSLTGIHAGLFAASRPFAFFAACDTPFLQKDLVQHLLQHIDPQVDVVIPEPSKGFYEPLCAVYSKACLKPIEAQLHQGRLQIIRFFRQIRLKSVPQTELRQSDPDLVSFFNINTPADLQKAEAMHTDQRGLA
jgi:molybdopterin-guanine dinucleotide biosynthesis protein A